MATLRTLLVVAGLTIAFACLAAMAVDDLTAASRRVRRRVGRLVRPESVRVALAQAGLTSIPVPAWILSRIGLAVSAAAIAWAWFRLPVLGLIACLGVHHLVGTALAFRRRGFQARHQEALLAPGRPGISVMSRAGSATSMLGALSEGGPLLGGEVVCARASGWMALGYGILQRMSRAPRESRLRLREATP